MRPRTSAVSTRHGWIWLVMPTDAADRDDTTADQALPGLVRAHPRGETVPAEKAADRVAAHVVADDGDHRTDQEGDPVAVREDRRVEE